MIPLGRPDFGEDEAAAVAEVLASGWISSGPASERLEAHLANLLDVRHVVATNSCTAALHLALEAAGVGRGDQVIVPSLTYAATVQAILMTGAEPCFADIHPETLTLDPDDVRRCITPRTRAVVPVHFSRQHCDLAALSAVAEDAGLGVVTDAAHAFPSACLSPGLADRSVATCFSFAPTKTLSCGEGGAVVTNDDELAERVRRGRALGMNRDAWSREQSAWPRDYSVVTPGYRCHLSDINAAIGLAQLERLDARLRRRLAIAEAYDRAMAPLEDARCVPAGGVTGPCHYMIRVPARHRDALSRLMAEQGVHTTVHYPPNHTQPAFAAFARPLPVTESAARTLLTLPLFPAMTDDEVHAVMRTLTRCLRALTRDKQPH